MIEFQYSKLSPKKFAYVSNQFESKVRTITTDNGIEFVNSNCQRLFSSMVIIHQNIVPYSPQQNGRVERKHQQLLQIAGAFLSTSGLLIKF